MLDSLQSESECQGPYVVDSVFSYSGPNLYSITGPGYYKEFAYESEALIIAAKLNGIFILSNEANFNAGYQAGYNDSLNYKTDKTCLANLTQLTNYCNIYTVDYVSSTLKNASCWDVSGTGVYESFTDRVEAYRVAAVYNSAYKLGQQLGFRNGYVAGFNDSQKNREVQAVARSIATGAFNKPMQYASITQRFV